MRASTRWGSMFCIVMGWMALGAAHAAETAPTKTPADSRQIYDACYQQAEAKKLNGKARLDFMSQCMNVKMPSGTVYN